MRESFPAALVQIHYHDRLGGVRQVMSDYSGAFRRIAGAGAHNSWWCESCGKERFGEGTVVDLPGADYHTYTTAGTFNKAVQRLTGIMMRRFDGVAGTVAPVAVIGHNLALGKNAALAGAFTRCARLLSGKNTRFRFFSVLHDFAEQGRYDLLANREHLRRCGVDISASLYAREAPVHFIAPDPRVRNITGLKETSLSILLNSVERRSVETSAPDRVGIRQQLRQCAQLDGCIYRPDVSLFCYPSRMIYRKNVLEALLLTTVLKNGSLLTGPSGGNGADRRRMKCALQLARKYGLSLVVDPGRMGPGGNGGENPFHRLLPAVDQAISTSIAEGFGYALYEPWLYGIPVTGRYPDGIALPDSLSAMSLYRRLPVPCSWVELDRCYEWFRKGTVAHSGMMVSKEMFIKRFVHEDTVDFGQLATAVQASIIKNVLRSDTRRAELTDLQKTNGTEIPGTVRYTGDVVRTTAEKIAAWSGTEYVSSFVKILSRRCDPPQNPEWFRSIEAWFRESGRWYSITPAAGMD